MGFLKLCFIHVCILIFVLVCCQAQPQLNDSCVMTDGNLGICLHFKNCPSAIELVKSRKGTPNQCGFEGKHPIVCCESKVLLKTRVVGEISRQKCEEAYQFLPATTKPPPTTEPPLPDNLTLAEIIEWEKRREEEAAKAGKPLPGVHKSAVGGVDAKPQEFFHMAALGYGERDQIIWGCGGSLISEKFVLTAAHCIHTSIGSVQYVRLGDLNLKLTNEDAKPQDFDIVKLILHPNYKAPSVYNDIAIVELSGVAVFDNYVRPGCLYTESEVPEKDLSATGWGLTSFNGEQADHLQEVQLRLFTFESCQKSYASMSKRRLANGIDDKSQVCVGETFRDTCRGDSGGPLHIKNQLYPRGYQVIGITSFGKACGVGIGASVYTRVSHYIEWIESIVWPET